MCGIIGYVGDGPAAPRIIQGLDRLDYRGYDSAGVAVGSSRNGREGFAVEKHAGKVEGLNGARELDGDWGIGHTRWATHGPPTEENAHPHTGCSAGSEAGPAEVAVAHNGIIENHVELREDLEAAGHEFTSETDSEVVAHLVEDLYDGDLVEALRRAVGRLEGSYALTVTHAREPGVIAAARRRSPLVVGLADEATLVSSDVTPLLEHTDEVVYLEDGDVARVGPDGVAVRTVEGEVRDAEPETVAWEAEDAEKGGYEHFMLKEIHEQPRALREVLSGRIGRIEDELDLDGSAAGLDQGPTEDAAPADADTGADVESAAAAAADVEAAVEAEDLDLVPDQEFEPPAEPDMEVRENGSSGTDLETPLDEEADVADVLLEGVERIVVLAMGTSHHAGLVGGRILERWAGLPVENRLSCEFRHGDPLPGEDTLVVAVSQSGETADTLEAVRRCRAAGAPVLAFTNVQGSTLDRVADGVLHLRAGPEISVAATKSFTNQVAAFLLLALHLGARRGSLPGPERDRLVEELRGLPRELQRLIEDASRKGIEDLAREVADHDHAFFLGRDVNVGTALEGALKLKEISYVHAEGHAGGELKHGPMALLEDQVPVVAVVAPDGTREKMLGNVREVEARDARVIALAPESDDEVHKTASEVLELPDVHPDLYPLVASVALQLLAYHAAKARDCPIDKPRNLAKSVTVE